MVSPARRLWPMRAGVLVGLAVAVLAGCNDDQDLGSRPTGVSQPVIVSTQYAASAGAEQQASRVAQVTEVVEQLRAATSGGWQARQDDVTGFAAELSGGRWSGPSQPADAARDFLGRYGAAFGLRSAADLSAPTEVAYDSAGVADVRMQQTHGGVLVEGSSLLVPVLRRGEVGEVSLARGRVFDVGEVATTATVPASKAAATVRALAGAPVTEQPTLVVLGELSVPRLA